MPKIAFLAFLIVGVILFIYGLNSSNSISSNVTEAVTGSPTDKSIWLIVLGVAGAVVGGLGLLVGRKQ